jgi:hypothetical protein
VHRGAILAQAHDANGDLGFPLAEAEVSAAVNEVMRQIERQRRHEQR